MLGRVDGFDEDEAECEGDDRAVVLCGLLTSERNPLEALQLAHGLLNAGATSVEQLREESRPVLGGALIGNGRADPARARRLAIGPGIIPLVAQSGAGGHVGADVEQDLEVPVIAGLAFSHVERK